MHTQTYNTALDNLKQNKKFNSSCFNKMKSILDKAKDDKLAIQDIVDLVTLIRNNVTNFKPAGIEILLRIPEVTLRDGIRIINDPKSEWTLETLAFGIREC